MKPILKYPGAKWKIAKWIISYIPEHSVYLEPFGGSMAVLLNKPRSHIETVNDIDDNIVNLFNVIRKYPNELVNIVDKTPFARSEYKKSFIVNESDTDIELARKYLVRCWQGFGSSNLYENGFKSGQQTQSPNPAKAWSKLSNTINVVSDRLKGVQIEKLDAIELIERYNTSDVFIYADPPYLLNTRKSNLYKNEMTDKQHIQLLNKLNLHPGKVMISAYENELYDSILVGWSKVYKNTVAESGNKRIECLYMNYHKELQLDL